VREANTAVGATVSMRERLGTESLLRVSSRKQIRCGLARQRWQGIYSNEADLDGDGRIVDQPLP
jgi:hypothetical protein